MPEVETQVKELLYPYPYPYLYVYSDLPVNSQAGIGVLRYNSAF